MPEYLSPGVYIQETSFRGQSIEGVSTSTAGFIGPTRFGPISGEPELITSLADFLRIYGDLENLQFGNLANPQVNYLAHGVRAFFEEGGKRLFVQRVFNAPGGFGIGDDGIPMNHYAVFPPNANPPPAAIGYRLVARFPGRAGNVRTSFRVQVGENIFRLNPGGNHILSRISNNTMVHVRDSRPAETHVVTAGEDFDDIADALNTANNPFETSGEQLAAHNDLAVDATLEDGQEIEVPPLYVEQGNASGLMIARRTVDGVWQLFDTDPDADGAVPELSLGAGDPAPAATLQVRAVSVLVEVATPGIAPDTFNTPQTLGEYSMVRTARNALLSTFTPNPDNRFDALTIPFAILPDDDANALSMTLLPNLVGDEVMAALSVHGSTGDDLTAHYTLEGGDDGDMPVPNNYTGDPALVDLTGDVLQMPINGLLGFEAMEDISIVASPGYTADRTDVQAFGIQNELVNHCESMQYRVAVLDTPENQTVTEALNFRNLRSSTHAAMYYPWVMVADPRNSRNGQPLKLPPSGFITGIYARNDNENAVFKAPANEVVRLATSFEVQITQAHQDLLNPNGVNCLRFFEGRGYLVWGARTISDNPEWKYISVRRYFAYLERSIDRSTQWAVFENNGPILWGKLRRAVEDFLYNEWVGGGLLGAKPEEAFFVRCDRSTMTQNDLDNGRLICQIGIAPVRPAEFIIFQIGQWTADADR